MVYFILDIFSDTFLDIFFCQIYLPLTLTVYDNLHQYSWLDDYVITNIDVANIVCDVYNLMILWWFMHCGKLADTVWFVDKHLTFCVVWKTSGDRVIRQQTFDILCGVENFRSPCDSSKDIWHSVWCGKLQVTVWFVNTFCVVWTSYWYRGD